jgi:hypothetical protein
VDRTTHAADSTLTLSSHAADGKAPT